MVVSFILGVIISSAAYFIYILVKDEVVEKHWIEVDSSLPEPVKDKPARLIIYKNETFSWVVLGKYEEDSFWYLDPATGLFIRDDIHSPTHWKSI